MRRGRFHGLRFQRRICVLPGVHLNVSLSGVGVSVGDRGFHAGVTARGQRYVSAGLPGTGLSDVGFRFKLMHWTHSTDPYIDSERAKVVNDLAFVGCVNAAALLSRTSADLVQDPKAEYPIRPS
jgi:hypothetical protein